MIPSCIGRTAVNKTFDLAKVWNLTNFYRATHPSCCATQRLLATATAHADVEKTFRRDKPHCNVGTLGHKDHGKTTLTDAITKVLKQKKYAQDTKHGEIDNARKDQMRGISNNSAHVQYATDRRHYAHTDCPGHADHFKDVVIGTNHMDGAILVVAATDGVMSQTREHLFFAKQNGIEHIVVYINKVDAADKEMVELIKMDIRELMSSMGFNGDNVPIVVGSALCALEGTNPEIGQESVMRLLDEVDRYIPEAVREFDKPFMMPIENIFSVPGQGTVVTGVPERGILKKGMECEIVGFTKPFKTNIAGIRTFSQDLEEGQAGDRLSAVVRGVKKEDVRRGMALCKPGTVKAHDQLEVQCYVLTEVEGGSPKPLVNYFQPMMYSKTWDCTAAIEIIGKEVLNPGEDGKLNLKLKKPMVLEAGQRFTLRNGPHTVGAGVVTKILQNLTEDVRKQMAKGLRKEKMKV